MRDPDLFDTKPSATPVEPGSNLWQRLTTLVKLLLVAAMIPALLMAFWPEWQSRERIDADVDSLRQQVDALEQRREDLTNELEWLQNDREYLEAVARARLHLAHEGETIVRFHEAPDRAE